MNELTIYYDGMCPLCAIEMRQLRAKDTAKAIGFLDINAEDFSTTHPHIDPVAASNVLHAEAADGQLLLGLDVTARAWQLVGHHRWVAMLRWPVIKPIADIFYRLFAKHRYRISALLTGKARCESCQID